MGDPMFLGFERLELTAITLAAMAAPVMLAVCVRRACVNLARKREARNQAEAERMAGAAMAEYGRKVRELESMFGKAARVMSIGRANCLDGKIIDFPDAGNVLILGRVHPYGSIGGCSVFVESGGKGCRVRHESRTSTKSLVKRAAVGGLLLGGLGALAGAATARRETTAVREPVGGMPRHVVEIWFREAGIPAIRISCGASERLANGILGMMDSIIGRNDPRRDSPSR